MKEPIEVEIFGQTFTLTSDDEEEYVREVAAYVGQKMQQVATTTKTVATLRVAILAALNIADEYYRARRREEEMRRQVDSLSDSLLERLSQAQGEPRLLPSDEERDPEAAGTPKRAPSPV